MNKNLVQIAKNIIILIPSLDQTASIIWRRFFSDTLLKNAVNLNLGAELRQLRYLVEDKLYIMQLTSSPMFQLANLAGRRHDAIFLKISDLWIWNTILDAIQRFIAKQRLVVMDISKYIPNKISKTDQNIRSLRYTLNALNPRHLDFNSTYRLNSQNLATEITRLSELRIFQELPELQAAMASLPHFVNILDQLDTLINSFLEDNLNYAGPDIRIQRRKISDNITKTMVNMVENLINLYGVIQIHLD